MTWSDLLFTRITLAAVLGAVSKQPSSGDKLMVVNGLLE